MHNNISFIRILLIIAGVVGAAIVGFFVMGVVACAVWLRDQPMSYIKKMIGKEE